MTSWSFGQRGLKLRDVVNQQRSTMAAWVVIAAVIVLFVWLMRLGSQPHPQRYTQQEMDKADWIDYGRMDAHNNQVDSRERTIESARKWEEHVKSNPEVDPPSPDL